MNKERDYLEDDVLFEDFDELDELDFGDKEKRAIDNINEEEVREKIEYVDDNLWGKLEKSGRRISFAKDILALYRYMKDPQVKWYRKAIVVAALIYFIVPIDTIPDMTPFFGYLDDLGVITALLKYLGSELMAYYPTGYRT
ncbi:MAG: YkvA family protein [Ignavibacteriaceae bacterium]